MEILLEQAIKNLKYMCNHSNLEHDRKSLRTVIKFVESYDERLKDDMVAMLTELQLEIEELDNPLDYDFEGYNQCAVDCEKIIQEKINSLKKKMEVRNK